MGSIWIALAWSAAAPAAWGLLSLGRERIEPYGDAAVVGAFLVAWFLCGRVLAGAARLLLPLVGIEVDEPSDPQSALERVRKELAAGRVPAAQGELAAAVCLVALGQGEEALAACERAEQAGARLEAAAELRWLRAGGLELCGRREQAAPLYKIIDEDPATPPGLRAAAHLRTMRLATPEQIDAAGDPVPEIAQRMTPRAEACRPCSGAGESSRAVDQAWEFVAVTAAELRGVSGSHRAAADRVLAHLEKAAPTAGAARAIAQLRKA